MAKTRPRRSKQRPNRPLAHARRPELIRRLRDAIVRRNAVLNDGHRRSRDKRLKLVIPRGRARRPEQTRNARPLPDRRPPTSTVFVDRAVNCRLEAARHSVHRFRKSCTASACPTGMPGPAIPQIFNRTAASAGADGVFGSTAALASGKLSSVSRLSDNDGGDQYQLIRSLRLSGNTLAGDDQDQRARRRSAAAAITIFEGSAKRFFADRRDVFFIRRYSSFA